MVISPVHFPSYQFWPRKKRGDSFFDSVFYFRRGSWALTYGLMALAKKRRKEKIRVWFPDYFCREPFDILKQFPITITFYPVTKKLTPNWEVLEQMANTKAPDAFVLVHYFGFPNDLAGATTFCEKYKIDLVEDCAHAMEPFGVVGTSGALSIWSPWKFFPLPELGILWVRDDLRDCVEIVPRSREILPLLRWWAKREAQRMLCGLGFNWYRRSHNSPSPDLASARSPSPNTPSLQLFKAYLCRVDHVRKRRIENYQTLALFFKETYPEMLVFETLPEGAVPYAFPFITDKPAGDLSKELIRRGIPAFPWPALPEEVVRDRRRYQWAHRYAGHLLLFPVHQNISSRQIEYMKQQIAIV